MSVPPSPSRAASALSAAVGGAAHLAVVVVWAHPLDGQLRPFDLLLPLGLAALAALTRSPGPGLVVFALVWCPELAARLGQARASSLFLIIPTLLLVLGARARRFHARSALLGLALYTAPLALLTLPVALRARDLGTPVAPTGAGAGPDILLLTVDTVRADAGLLDGLPLTRTYSRAVAPAPWTLPSMQALFTGVPARESGAGFPVEGGWSTHTRPSLIHAFREAGYDTRAWICNPHLTSAFASGFNHVWHADDSWAPLPTHVWDDLRRRRTGQVETLRHTRDERLEAAVRTAMDEADSGPRFYWVHLLSPHEYRRDPAGPAATDLRRQYAENVAATRARIARLLRPGWIVAITSDHGEAFGEGGVDGHGHRLHDAELRVPLGFYGADPGPDTGQVATLGVLPTLGRLAGVVVPGQPLAQEAVAVGPPRRSAELAVRGPDGVYTPDSARAAAGPSAALDLRQLEALGYTAP